ncbi:MAG: hypothetical protein AAB448_03700 [Patescibacteria group bacterium]
MILSSMTVNGMAQLQDVFTDARAYGARLAQLLASSTLPEDVQNAWAALVPSMTLSHMQHFELLLRAHMDGKVQGVLEDAFLEIRAEITKHELATAGATYKAHVELDAIEKQLDALERAGGKRTE